MSNRWCNSAKLRRNQIESGLDITFNEVFKPLFIQKINSLNSKRILEVGAGTGHLSKELSQKEYEITAIEPSQGMYEITKEVLVTTNVELLNCTSFDLKKMGQYDVAFSHLVAHVVDDLSAFYNSIGKHLQPNGYFIFSIPHPCFFNGYKRLFGSEYNYMESRLKNISFSITKDPDKKISEVPYHHPLSEYINNLVNSGFSIEDFDEIYPDKTIQEKYGFLWEKPRYCLLGSVLNLLLFKGGIA